VVPLTAKLRQLLVLDVPSQAHVRYSIYLLYWYKSTCCTSTKGPGVRVQVAREACTICLRMRWGRGEEGRGSTEGAAAAAARGDQGAGGEGHALGGGMEAALDPSSVSVYQGDQASKASTFVLVKQVLLY
jgi:hypothetical protein